MHFSARKRPVAYERRQCRPLMAPVRSVRIIDDLDCTSFIRQTLRGRHR